MPYSQEHMRAYIVGLHIKGESASAIAKRPEVDVSRATVSRWIKRFNEEGFDGLKTVDKSGRPAILNANDSRLVVACVAAQPKRACPTVVREVFPEFQGHKSTIYRSLQRAGYNCREPAGKSQLPEANRAV